MKTRAEIRKIQLNVIAKSNCNKVQHKADDENTPNKKQNAQKSPVNH